MMKTFFVVGSNWISEVELDTEHLTDEGIKVEAATRALEQHFGKRHDIPYRSKTPICLTEEEREEDQLHTALIELLTEELEEGCGIGMLLCIIEKDGPEEWFINSKSILENVGVPNLVKRFNEKYSTKKTEDS